MDYICAEQLDQNQLDQIFKLICDADKEFVPPLSSRNSTTQTNLSENADRGELPYEYFEGIKDQAAILAVEDNKIIGFMSFIPEKCVKMGKKQIHALYLSTIIVDKENRRRGISYGMYQFLLDKYKDKNIITRTWSTNLGHLELLKKLGFQLIKCIPDDRGEGIDTVYYGRLDTGKKKLTLIEKNQSIPYDAESFYLGFFNPDKPVSAGTVYHMSSCPGE